MSLADRLEAQSAATIPGPDCGVARLLEELPPSDRDEITEALGRTRTILTSVLQRALNAEYKRYVSVYTLRRHRSGQCKCARTS